MQCARLGLIVVLLTIDYAVGLAFVLANILVFVVGNHAVGAGRFFILENAGSVIGPGSVDVRSGGLGRSFGRYGEGGHDGEQRQHGLSRKID